MGPFPVHTSNPSPDIPVRDGLSLTFWGVRGSVPTARADTTIYGGNTPCIEVTSGNRSFIVDAGTGIVSLGKRMLASGPRKVDLLLTHLHHDHVMGLFFFKPLFQAGFELTIHCGNLGGETAEAALRRLFSPPLFPIQFDDLPATLHFNGFRSGETLRFDDGTEVKTCPLAHPSGATGYRFEHGGASAAVITDIEHSGNRPDPAVVAFSKGCELIVYDAMFASEDYTVCKGWGHSTIEAGVELCRAAGARRLAAFHHHPAYSDDRLAELDQRLAANLPGSFVAREGQHVELCRSVGSGQGQDKPSFAIER